MMSSSFFDDDDPTSKNQGFWKTINKRTRIKESKFQTNPEKYFQSTLHKRTKKTNDYKALIFIMFGNRLSYIKNGYEAGYILLDNHTLNTFESKGSSDFKFGFRLIKNRHYTEFYTESKERLNEWVERLKKHCIMNHFFNDFSAVCVLGKGNFAKVYKVKSKNTGKQFAAKIFEKTDVSKSPKLKKALIHELKILRILDHPYILKMHQVYEGEQHIYLLFDIMYGRELFDRVLTHKYYSEENAAKILKRLVEALKYIEKKEVLHRDIKLENILLEFEDDDTSIKVGDFGLSVMMKDFDPSVRCGTPGYVAPEVLHANSYDYKADIFSVGVVLYILLSGSAPFPGKSFDEIISRNKKCQPKYSPKYWDKVSTDATSLVKNMLHPDPKERPSWRELMENEWLKRMTFRDDNILVVPDYIESSCCYEEDDEAEEKILGDSPENINGEYMEEMIFGARKRSENIDFEAQFNGTLSDDKMLSRFNSDTTKFSERSFEKKNSMKILDSFEGQRPGSYNNSSQLKKFAITKNMLNRLKDSKVGLEGFMPKTKTPFNFNVFSGPNLNSFYKRTGFISSFNKDDSASFSHSQEESCGKRYYSPQKFFPPHFDFGSELNSPNTPNTPITSNSHGLSALDMSKQPDEEIPTATINEFFAEPLTLAQKIKQLNDKTYTFVPSLSKHTKKSKAKINLLNSD